MKTKLKSLYLYLTDQCNLACIHCWQSAPLEGKGNFSRLKYEDCEKFLEDAVDMGLASVTFSGGKPLLNDNFHRFADFFHSKGIHIAMETNGLLISEDAKIKNSIIQKTLIPFMHDRLTIIISHRLSSLLGVERFVILENGRITNIGNHKNW
jgi:MoaA/NifB/PqqE/SkfB family radical SAM enzyme